jgi:dihydrofolate synthase/folylpolyglutamate synthase
MLEKIAAEKAGIIKPGVPVVTATDEPEALEVIGKIAREKKAPLKVMKMDDVHSRLAGTLAPPLPGKHQKLNAALALATVEVLQKQIPVAAEKIRAGLSNVRWPGRLQLIEKPNGQKILLDGAHNVAGVEALCAALTQAGGPLKGAFIIGFLGDKDWRPMCERLAPLASKIFTVPVASTRTADASELAKTFRSANPAAKVFACESCSEALHASKNEPFVVVAGSLYLVGEALELLGLSPTASGERPLNEWSGLARTANKSSKRS